MHIRQARLARKLAQKALAEDAGVPLSALKRWERGLELPEETDLGRLARVLSVDVEALKASQRKYVDEATPGEGYVTATNGDGTKVFRRTGAPPTGSLKVLDLFCGSGGFSHGMEATGHFAVTGGIDLLPDRIDTFRRNHAFADAIAGDIKGFSPEGLSDHALQPDLVIGGPPCQGFSSIRPFRSCTEGDRRNNLYEYFGLTVGILRPRWFVLENVVGLLTHRGGRSFKELIQTFREAGYRVDWRVINGACFGLPQNRERLVVVGNRAGRSFEWPLPTHESDYRSMAGNGSKLLVPEPLLGGPLWPALSVMEAIHDLPPVGPGETATTYRTDVEPTSYEAMLRGGERELTLHTATAHSERMIEIIRKAGQNRSSVQDLTTSGFSSSYSRLDPEKPSVTLTVNFVHPASNKCIHPHQDRALTPREGARLQGFPDSFEFAGTRSQVVKQIGNAVPPLLGQIIGNALASQW